MYKVSATELKNRLGPVLARAQLGPVAIVRHGRVVAYLTPATEPPPGRRRPAAPAAGLGRRDEERLARFCASRDVRPSRWRRAGDAELMAGIAVMLASQPEFDRLRYLALAEQLNAGMTRPEAFGRWLERAPVRAARFLPLVRAELASRRAR